MTGTLKKLLVGASIAVGMSAIAPYAAVAGTLTGASIGGSAPNDYLVYTSGGGTTSIDPTKNVQAALDGNSSAPGGNVELAASSENGGFDFTKNTTLTGTIGGKTLTLSSLTATDWFGAAVNTNYGANTFATKWFNEFLTNAGKGNFVGTLSGALGFNAFLNIGGFQRSSDPNISYVNQDDATGKISIGLAGHKDLKAFYASKPEYAFFAGLVKDGFQASEVVKYSYNGVSDFLYSFSATDSGLIGDDGSSHNGNYEVSIAGVPAAVPEPATLLGLMAVGGLFATNRKLKKA